MALAAVSPRLLPTLDSIFSALLFSGGLWWSYHGWGNALVFGLGQRRTSSRILVWSRTGFTSLRADGHRDPWPPVLQARALNAGKVSAIRPAMAAQRGGREPICQQRPRPVNKRLFPCSLFKLKAPRESSLSILSTEPIANTGNAIGEW